jgi:hypothetical protein
LQESYAREGKLDQALAIRACIRRLRSSSIGVPLDPGNLLNHQGQIGKSLVFEIVVSNQGPLWGTDVYTLDSFLAVAAAHAGIVRIGERGLVKVMIRDTSKEVFQGSLSNGVQSHSWGPYQIGYRVAKP